MFRFCMLKFPATAIAHAVKCAGIANIVLYDLQGRVVETLRATSRQGTATINMRNIPAGVYVLHVTDGEGKEYQQKVVRR